MHFNISYFNRVLTMVPRMGGLGIGSEGGIFSNIGKLDPDKAMAQVKKCSCCAHSDLVEQSDDNATGVSNGEKSKSQKFEISGT